MNTPTTDVAPGFLAFVAFFLLALALWFLMRNMNARMRRMSYRQQAAHRGKDDPQADGSTPVVAGAADTGGAPGRPVGPDRGPDPDPSPTHGPAGGHGGSTGSHPSGAVDAGGPGGDGGGGD